MTENNSRPLILVSNDDGYMAKGINVLVRVLMEFGDVVVVAPHTGRSGKGCAITSEVPVKVWKVSEEQGLQVYACTGTPCDCVKIAFDSVLSRRPSLVVGGINHGDNSKEVPSIAFSLCSHDADADFSATLPVIRRVVAAVLQRGLPTGSCLNVNFPDAPSYAGVRVCRQAYGQWVNEWKGHEHPNGGTWYWLTGSFQCSESGSLDADKVALENNYVAITPTKIDLTDYSLLNDMQGWGL